MLPGYGTKPFRSLGDCDNQVFSTRVKAISGFSARPLVSRQIIQKALLKIAMITRLAEAISAEGKVLFRIAIPAASS